MKTLLKIMGGLLVLLVVLIIAAIVIIPRIFDPNDYKDDLAALVQKETGRELAITGPVELSLFPWLGARVGEAALGNAPGFGETAFARIGTAQIRLKLLPLLSKRIIVDRIILEGFTMNLIRDAQGRTNWDDLVKSRLPGQQAPSAPPSQPQPDSDSGQPGSPPLEIEAVTIGGLEVTDAQISWDDRQNKLNYRIKDLDLTTGTITPGQPITLQLDSQVASSQPPMEGQLKLQGNLHLDTRRARLQLPDLVIEAQAQGADMPADGVKGHITAQVDLNGLTQSLDVQNLKIDLTDLITLEGSLQGQDIAARPKIKGQFQAAPFDARQVAQRFGLELPPMADESALGKVAARLGIDYGPDQLAISDLQLTLDDSTLTGTLQVPRFSPPIINFDAELDSMNVDRYLPPATPVTAAAPAPAETDQSAATPPPSPTPTSQAQAPQDPELPLETLRTLSLDGSLTITKLTVADIALSDVALTLTGKEGRIAIAPVLAKLFDGQVESRAELDVRGDRPRIKLAPTVTGLQVGPLLQALTGEDRLTGVTVLTADITAHGLTPAAIKQSLNGRAAFTFTDGSVKGINLAQMIRSAQAKLAGQAAPPPEAAPKTDFAELKGTVKLVNGLIQNNDLSAKSPLMRITGRGTADLPGEALDYRLKTTLVGTLEGQGGKEMAELTGIPIPIHITGTFNDPRFALDLQEVLTERAKAEAQKQIETKLEEELTNRVDEEVGDVLKKSLKNLFQ